MACDNDIDLVDVAEERITVMQRTNLDFSLLFFLDEDFLVEDTLEGSTFEMTIKDKDGNEILALGTEATPGGITINGYNELVFDKAADEMDLAVGNYKYVLQRTYEGKTFPEMRGDFVVIENTN